MNKNPAAVNIDNAVKSMFFHHLTPRDIRFMIIVTGVFVFFAGHNFMQEYIMSLPGFSVSLCLFHSSMSDLLLLSSPYSMLLLTDWHIPGLP
jgi:hypothetical protein